MGGKRERDRERGRWKGKREGNEVERGYLGEGRERSVGVRWKGGVNSIVRERRRWDAGGGSGGKEEIGKRGR